VSARQSWQSRLPADAWLADLILAADPEFYALFGLNHDRLIHAIRAAMNDKASDVGQWIALLEDSRIIGLFAAYPVAEMMKRQTAGLRFLVLAADDPKPLRRTLCDFAAQRPPPANDAYYLARIATIPQARGKGVGRRLLDRFEAVARAMAFRRTALHVRRGNVAAEHLYASAGYQPTANDTGLPYAALEKQLF
jgi:ribosomal protein S18 acetylase RimI-like enzyme